MTKAGRKSLLNLHVLSEPKLFFFLLSLISQELLELAGSFWSEWEILKFPIERKTPFPHNSLGKAFSYQ